jgi:hypothetical protein
LNPLILAGIPQIIDLIRATVTDKDKANELAAMLEKMALQTATNPIADGLHKLSRTIQAVVIVTAITILKFNEISLTPAELAAMCGLSAGYSLLKGKGK